MGGPSVGGPGAGAQESLGKLLNDLILGRPFGPGDIPDRDPLEVIQELFQGLSIPGFEGPLSAPLDPLQTEALGAAQESLAGGVDFTADEVLRAITGGGEAVPPEVQALLDSLGGRGTLEAFARGETPLAGFLTEGDFGVDTSVLGGFTTEAGFPVDLGALQGLAGLLGPTAGESTLAGLTTTRGGTGTDTLSQLVALLGPTTGEQTLASLLTQRGGAGTSALSGFAGLLGPTAGEERLLGLEEFAAPGVLGEAADTGFRTDIESLLATIEQRGRRGIEEQVSRQNQQFALGGTRASVGRQRGEAELRARGEEAIAQQTGGLAAQLFESAAGRRLQAGELLGNLGLAARGQDVQAGGILGELGQAERARATGAAGTLGGLELGELQRLTEGATALGQLGQAERARATGAAGTLGGLELGELQRVTSAAQGLGELGAAERARATGAAGQLGGLNLGAAQLSETERQRATNAATSLVQALLSEAGLAQTERTRATGAAEAAGAQQLGAATTAGQQDLASANLLSTLFGEEQGRQLQAALALPGAEQLAATLPILLATQAFGLGEQARQVEDVDILRQIQQFSSTQGALFGPILNAILGTPVAFGPSTGSQALAAGTTIGSAAVGKGG